MTTLRSRLREQLSDRLVPLLLERGFDGPNSISGNTRGHTFTRVTESEKHEIDISFEKHGAARFGLSLYAYPYPVPDSLRGKVVDIPTGSVSPQRGAWFRADLTIIDKLLGRDELSKLESAVASCIGCLPEVDNWWENRSDSDHIQTLNLPGTLSD